MKNNSKIKKNYVKLVILTTKNRIKLHIEQHLSDFEIQLVRKIGTEDWGYLEKWAHSMPLSNVLRKWPKTTYNFAIRAYVKFMKIDALSLFSQQKPVTEKSQEMHKMGIKVGVDHLVFKKNAQN